MQLGIPSVKKNKENIFPPTDGARSLISPNFAVCMVTEDVVTILKGVNHFSIRRRVFPSGATMLIFDTMSK